MRPSLNLPALALMALLFPATFVPNLSADQIDTGRLQFDFNRTNLPPGASLFDHAYIGDDGSGLNGCLHLTDPGVASSGHLKLSNIGEGMNVTRLQIQWRSLIGGGSGADGYSINWANDLPKAPVYANPGEEGAGSGITVAVDTYENGVDDILGLALIWKTNVVGTLGISVDNLRRNTFVNASLTVDETGLATVDYDGLTLNAQLDGWTGITKGNLIISGRTGDLDDRHWIDELDVAPRGVMPGTYAGLFHDSENWQHTNSGSVNLKVTPKGTYSGALVLGGAKLAFTGQFDRFERTSQAHVIPTGGLPITIDLEFTSNDSIQGTVSNEVWQTSLAAERLVWNTKTKPATSHVGQYSFAVESNPVGFGYGTASVDLAGKLKFTGILGDGSKVSQQTFVGPTGDWNIYLSTHAGKGSFQGRMSAVNVETNHGELAWFKPSTSLGTIYPGAFEIYPDTYVAPYTPPSPGQRVLPFSFGQAIFAYGPGGAASHFGLTINNQFVDLGTNHLTIKFAPKTGLVTGSVVDPVNLGIVKFGGVVFTPQSAVVGHFLESDLNGSVLLMAAEPAGSPGGAPQRPAP